ncbi:EF-P beta-lysylation protein EpmB [Paraglaciecola aquimarina]|uniref:L-lysine 2,3-aminomutase n=1 Tax=Paraglaciecola algarum TaxID=3050085 RepID=A0ABS9D814_9ALTE|nr:EF-P beta-lysylation protein EpmB [Paraglaciecola sp. G1-23]MCF2949070.1 EF-P beta-lysylation protein EpmB [Paraglaciecola sp. G1-23]
MSQIIPKKPLSVESNWQKEIATSFSDPESLLNYLNLPTQNFSEDVRARALFPMRVPRSFAARMKKGDPTDPLFLQVFTSRAEFLTAKGFSKDPLEEQNNQQPGILHKYKNRLLLLVRGGCAVNCRYCFRRHFPYGDNHLNKNEWQQAITYIRDNPQIDEVIYSGGDPLMAKDDFLAWLTSEIENISHVKRLRIHTRLPVVIPSRITTELINWFTQTRLKPVLVLHINHANEIDQSLTLAMQKLKDAGVTLLNQAVLLKGINDTVEQQIALNEGVFGLGIMPYYLHVLDKVEGAEHFDVPECDATNLMAELIKHQPGYLVPKLVREIAGQPGKTPLDLNLHP